MTRTKHELHTTHQPWCPACRWARKTPEQQDQHRQHCRERAINGFRIRKPERAAVRSRVTAGATPEPCDRCANASDTRAILDYAAERIVAWRCGPCWNAARQAWRSERKAA